MNEEKQKRNYQPFILTGIVVAFIGLGWWIQTLQTKLAEVNSQTNQIITYINTAIQAGVFPNAQQLKAISKQQQKPEQQEPLPMTPSPVPTKAK